MIIVPDRHIDVFHTGRNLNFGVEDAGKCSFANTCNAILDNDFFDFSGLIFPRSRCIIVIFCHWPAARNGQRSILRQFPGQILPALVFFLNSRCRSLLVKEREQLLKLFFRCRELLLLFLGQAVKGIVGQLDLFVCGDLFLLGHLFQSFPGREGRQKGRNLCQGRIFRILTGLCHGFCPRFRHRLCHRFGFWFRYGFRYRFCDRFRYGLGLRFGDRFCHRFRFRLGLVFCLGSAFLAQEGAGVLIGYVAAFLRVGRMGGT